MNIMEELNKKGEHATALVHKVANNDSRYNKRDHLKAVQDRKLQRMIGRPTTKKFLGYIKNKIISICPVTRSYILAT